MSGQHKIKAVEAALAEIKKRYGEHAIMRLGDRGNINVEVIPTDILSLDYALGVGGLPKGRIIEIYGPESSGKSTLCLHAIAATQKRGGAAAFIDMEHALDPLYAEGLGVDIENLLLAQPDYGEQALEILEALVRSGAMDIVVVDSVAALVPRAEIEGDMGSSSMGLQARLMSQAMRKLAGAIQQTDTVVIFTNQLRQKIGVMFGNPETTPGGNALKFYASIRMDIRKIGSPVKVGDTPVGHNVRIKVAKNKVAPPFRQAEIFMRYGEGFDKIKDVLETAVKNDIVTKRGAYYSYGEERIGQGGENARKYLAEHPELLEKITQELREKLFGSADATYDERVETDA